MRGGKSDIIDSSSVCVMCSLVPGAEEERLVHTDALPVN